MGTRRRSFRTDRRWASGITAAWRNIRNAGADIRRVTLTAPFLNRSLRAVVLVTGAEKAARVQEVMEGPFTIRTGCQSS